MANLPDLDTSKVSYIAYWNHLDNGASEITPMDTTSWGRINNYTLYDNGIEGEWSIPNGDTGKFRVKNDGWILTWVPAQESIGPTQSVNNIQTPMSVIGWQNQGTCSTLGQNRLAKGIQSLRNQLSSSGTSTFNFGDVGLYAYHAQSATNATVLSAARSDEFNSTGDYGWLYTSGTNLVRGRYGGRSDNGSMTVNKTGDKVHNSGGGVVDILANNYEPDTAGSEVTYEIEADSYDSAGHTLICWD